MSTNIVSMKAIQLPANIAGFFEVDSIGDDLSAGVTGGFAVVSIRGSKWRIKHAGEEHPVLDVNGEPVPSLEVVLLKASKDVSRIYYAKSFEEGDAEEPDCYSLDGHTPDAGVRDKQSETCASCPHAVWGSRITPAGKKAKACQDNRRVAVVPASDLKNEVHGGPMLLRVPAASLADLATYGKVLKNKGFPYNALVTRIGFDLNAAYPKLTFKPVRALDATEMDVLAQHFTGDVLHSIMNSVPAAEAPVSSPAVDTEFEQPPAAPVNAHPVETPVVEAAPEPKPEPPAEVAAAVAAADAVAPSDQDSSLVGELDDLLSELEDLS